MQPESCHHAQDPFAQGLGPYTEIPVWTRASLVINKHKLWSRVFTYIPTPTANDGDPIDENALRQVIDYQIEDGG